MQSLEQVQYRSIKQEPVLLLPKNLKILHISASNPSVNPTNFITLESLLGQGYFCNVYKSKIYSEDGSNNQRKVALKIGSLNNGHLQNEILIYKKCFQSSYLKNFFINEHVPLPIFISYGKFKYMENDFCYLIMNIYQYNFSDILGLFPQKDSLFKYHMLESVETLFKSLSYLSRFHIVHGHLKSTNILVQQLSPSHTKKLVLHDFGLAAHPGQFETTSTFYGPLRYASLDVHNNLRTQRADIFMVMYNLLDWLNLCPWCSDDSIEVVKNKKENFQMNISQFLSKQSCDENLVKYFENVFQILLSLDYKETPNYSLLSELTKKHALYYNNIFTKHENNVLNVQSIPTKFEILEIDSPKKPSNITIISTTIDPISMKNLYQQLSTNFEVVLAISSFCVNSCSSGFVLVYKLHNIPFFKKPIVTSQAITKYFSKSLSECNLITEGILYGLKLLKKEFKKFFIVFNNTVLYDMLNNFKNYGTCESIYNMELTKEFEGTECTIYSTSDKYLTELSTAEAMASNVNLRK